MVRSGTETTIPIGQRITFVQSKLSYQNINSSQDGSLLVQKRDHVESTQILLFQAHLVSAGKETIVTKGNSYDKTNI